MLYRPERQRLTASCASSREGFAVLAHAILFAQNVAVNGSEAQKRFVLPKAASGAAPWP